MYKKIKGFLKTEFFSEILFKKVSSSLYYYLIFCLTTVFIWSLVGFLNGDIYFKSNFLAKQTINPEIVVVAIDQYSLDKYGSWPWNREIISDKIRLILDNNPKKIGIDILFEEKPNTQNSSQKLNQVLQDDRLVIAEALDSSDLPKLDPIISRNVQTGLIHFPFENNGSVYLAEPQIEGQSTLSVKMVENHKKSFQYSDFLLRRPKNYPRTISIEEITDDSPLLSTLENKYVLIGSTSPGLGDFYQFANEEVIAGVYLHSFSLNQILNEDFPQIDSFNPLSYLSLILILGYLLIFFSEFYQIPKYLYLILGLLVFGLFFFLLIDYLSISFGIGLITGYSVFITSSYWNKFSLEKRRLHTVLKSHLSSAVLNQALDQAENIDLGGQNYQITIIFTDIRGFTKLSEQIEPNEIGRILNEFLGLQADIVLKHQGLVDKFIGDSIMAFWGAPIQTKNHTQMALECAMEILEKTKEYAKNSPFNLELGIGIHTGQAAVGNFGSKKRLSYTAIGDTVNTASRIESLNKDYKTNILLTKEVLMEYENNLVNNTKDKFSFKFIDEVKPRGKVQKVKLYTIKN